MIAIAVLFWLVNDAIEASVTICLAKFFDHCFAHETDPAKTFTGDTLAGPEQFTLFILEVGLVLLGGQEGCVYHAGECIREMSCNNR